MKMKTPEDKDTNKKSIFWDTKLATCFMVLSFLVYSAALKMEATFSAETLLDFQRTTWRYFPEDRNFYNQNGDNPKPYKPQ
jgi:hypothetical protein